MGKDGLQGSLVLSSHVKMVLLLGTIHNLSDLCRTDHALRLAYLLHRMRQKQDFNGCGQAQLSYEMCRILSQGRQGTCGRVYGKLDHPDAPSQNCLFIYCTRIRLYLRTMDVGEPGLRNSGPFGGENDRDGFVVEHRHGALRVRRH